MKKYIFAALLTLALCAPCRAEDVENGKKIYLRICAKCHGPDGSGSRYGRALKDPVRDLRTNRLFFSNNDLFMIINHGATWHEMPNQRYVLRVTDEGETKDVSAYLRTLTYAPDLKNGEKLFKERCALCHATEGAAKLLWKALDLDKSQMGPFEMARVIRYGIHSTLMYPRESLHSNTEIADVVGYIEKLKK